MTARIELTTGGLSARRTLAEVAAAELHELILSGELPAGSPLRLVDLAKRLRMSQMPVREGLRRLEALGLVEVIPHRGAWVRELSMDDLIDTHKTRLTLESLAVRDAAVRFTEADAERAGAALAEHVRLTKAGDHVAARFVHTEFHFAIYRACGSKWLPRAIEPVWQNSERYRFGGPRGRVKIEAARLEHQAILDACIARDPDGAEAALRAHLEGVMGRITESMIARGKAAPAKESE